MSTSTLNTSINAIQQNISNKNNSAFDVKVFKSCNVILETIKTRDSVFRDKIKNVCGNIIDITINYYSKLVWLLTRDVKLENNNILILGIEPAPWIKYNRIGLLNKLVFCSLDPELYTNNVLYEKDINNLPISNTMSIDILEINIKDILTFFIDTQYFDEYDKFTVLVDIILRFDRSIFNKFKNEHKYKIERSYTRVSDNSVIATKHNTSKKITTEQMTFTRNANVIKNYFMQLHNCTESEAITHSIKYYTKLLWLATRKNIILDNNDLITIIGDESHIASYVPPEFIEASNSNKNKLANNKIDIETYNIKLYEDGILKFCKCSIRNDLLPKYNGRTINPSLMNPVIITSLNDISVSLTTIKAKDLQINVLMYIELLFPEIKNTKFIFKKLSSYLIDFNNSLNIIPVENYIGETFDDISDTETVEPDNELENIFDMSENSSLISESRVVSRTSTPKSVKLRTPTPPVDYYFGLRNKINVDQYIVRKTKNNIYYYLPVNFNINNKFNKDPMDLSYNYCQLCKDNNFCVNKDTIDNNTKTIHYCDSALCELYKGELSNKIVENNNGRNRYLYYIDKFKTNSYYNKVVLDLENTNIHKLTDILRELFTDLQFISFCGFINKNISIDTFDHNKYTNSDLFLMYKDIINKSKSYLLVIKDIFNKLNITMNEYFLLYEISIHIAPCSIIGCNYGNKCFNGFHPNKYNNNNNQLCIDCLNSGTCIYKSSYNDAKIKYDQFIENKINQEFDVYFNNLIKKQKIHASIVKDNKFKVNTRMKYKSDIYNANLNIITSFALPIIENTVSNNIKTNFPNLTSNEFTLKFQENMNTILNSSKYIHLQGKEYIINNNYTTSDLPLLPTIVKIDTYISNELLDLLVNLTYKQYKHYLTKDILNYYNNNIESEFINGLNSSSHGKIFLQNLINDCIYICSNKLESSIFNKYWKTYITERFYVSVNKYENIYIHYNFILYLELVNNVYYNIWINRYKNDKIHNIIESLDIENYYRIIGFDSSLNEFCILPENIQMYNSEYYNSIALPNNIQELIPMYNNYIKEIYYTPDTDNKTNNVMLYTVKSFNWYCNMQNTNPTWYNIWKYSNSSFELSKNMKSWTIQDINLHINNTTPYTFIHGLYLMQIDYKQYKKSLNHFNINTLKSPCEYYNIVLSDNDEDYWKLYSTTSVSSNNGFIPIYTLYSYSGFVNIYTNKNSILHAYNEMKTYMSNWYDFVRYYNNCKIKWDKFCPDDRHTFTITENRLVINDHIDFITNHTTDEFKNFVISRLNQNNDETVNENRISKNKTKKVISIDEDGWTTPSISSPLVVYQNPKITPVNQHFDESNDEILPQNTIYNYNILDSINNDNSNINNKHQQWYKKKLEEKQRRENIRNKQNNNSDSDVDSISSESSDDTFTKFSNKAEKNNEDEIGLKLRKLNTNINFNFNDYVSITKERSYDLVIKFAYKNPKINNDTNKKNVPYKCGIFFGPFSKDEVEKLNFNKINVSHNIIKATNNEGHFILIVCKEEKMKDMSTLNILNTTFKMINNNIKNFKFVNFERGVLVSRSIHNKLSIIEDDDDI